MAADRAALEAVHEIGPEIAGSLESYFREERNRRVIARLLELGLTVTGPGTGGGPRPLEGKIFVFTGGLARLTRDEAARLVEERGGRVASSVSKKTHYVVAGADPGSKLKEAQRLGVTVLDEAAFAELIGRA